MAHETLFAISFLVGDGGDGCPSTGMNRISADARRLEDQPLSSSFGLQHRNAGNVLCRYDPTGRQPTSTRRQVWERVYVRFRKWPTSGAPNPIVWSLQGNIEGSPALCLRVGGSGTVTLCNQGNQSAPGEALGSVTAVLNTWYCYEFYVLFNGLLATPPNPPYENDAIVEMRVNGQVAFHSTRAGVNPQYGVDKFNQQAVESRLGDTINVGKGLEIDYADWIGDTADWVGPLRRMTVAKPVGAGTYTDWSGGNPDYRHQLEAPFVVGNIPGVSTQAANARQTYAVESLASLGITGEIFSARIAAYFETVPAGDIRLIVRRNSADSEFNIGTAPQWAWSTWRIPTTGWSPSDSIEIGVKNLANPPGSSTRLGACALLVEHGTPPWSNAPTDSAVRILETSYTGNGTQQSIDLAALDPSVASLVPSFVAVLPQSGSGAGAWWWDARVYPSLVNNAGASWGIVPRPGTVVVAGLDASTNQNGITYRLIACFDTLQRVMARGAVSLESGSGDRVESLPPGFTPDAVFIAREQAYLNDATKVYYRGAGHAGDQSVSLGANVSAVSGAIRGWTSGNLEIGTLIKEVTQDFAFMAWRTNQFTGSPLVAVTSYVGNGSSPRAISLALGGATPKYALCVPTNTGQRWTRYGNVTRQWSGSTTGSTNAITAFGSDSITVGSELNVNGITYSVFALATGVDEAPERRLILLIGYWPPTDKGNMLAAFASRQQYRKLNGQLTNYDVLALSAVFTQQGTFGTGNWPFYKDGTGLFRVDYRDTSTDFWQEVPGRDPIAILSFSWMPPGITTENPDGFDWKLERNGRNLARTVWLRDVAWSGGTYTIDPPYIGGDVDDPSPFGNTGKIPGSGDPPDKTVAAGTAREGLASLVLLCQIARFRPCCAVI